MTVGTPSLWSRSSIKQWGLARAFYEAAIEKPSLVLKNLKTRNGRLVRHPGFDGYVSDHKRIVSYNLGMAFAKLYSERILEMPRLIHIEQLKRMGSIEFTLSTGRGSNREPDLVGMDRKQQWHLFEAKGVSGGRHQLPGKIKEAKGQCHHVLSVNGAAPATKVACATYIGGDQILSRIEDPADNGAKEFEFERDEYLSAYYKSFLLFDEVYGRQSRDASINGFSYKYVTVGQGSDKIQFGLSSEVIDLVNSGSYDDLIDLEQALVGYSGLSDEKFSIGQDGFIVRSHHDQCWRVGKASKCDGSLSFCRARHL